MSILFIITFISMYLWFLVSGKISKLELLTFKAQTGGFIIAAIGTLLWFVIYGLASLAGFI